MNGKCKLCEKEAKLILSHFIPKFVGKWIKKTSITGFIRDSDNINKRQQDIAKEYWLCENCEKMFSDWERQFANRIFYPFVNEEKSVTSYEDWLSKFCVSLSWRTLTYTRSRNRQDNKTDEYNANVNQAKIQMSKYLRGVSNNLNEYEQHIFPLERIESTTEAGLPPNINRYFLRIMAMDIIGNKDELFIYTKLPSFIILGFIKVKNRNIMRSSRVALKHGKISPCSYRWPDGFIDYIVNKAQKASDLAATMEPNQQNRIDEFIKNNPEKAIKSKLFQAFSSDYNMFGERALRKDKN